MIYFIDDIGTNGSTNNISSSMGTVVFLQPQVLMRSQGLHCTAVIKANSSTSITSTLVAVAVVVVTAAAAAAAVAALAPFSF